MVQWIVRGGSVVLPQGVERVDVAVDHGTIVDISPDLDCKADRTLDASGLFVLPGIIDVHTHPVYLDDLESLPRTAAFGGVTTVIHFAYAKPGEGLLETIHRFREDGEAVSRLDFALHGGLFDPAHQADEIPDAMNVGVTSHKMFMTYAKLGWMTDDYHLMRTLDILGRVGGLGMVHAENGLATDYLEDKNNEQGVDPKEAFVATRPAILEAEAIHRAVAMAQVAGCPLYIPHMTAQLGIEEVARARAAGYRVYAETCPQYLTLTSEALEVQGPLAKIGPPLRDPSDRSALWEALGNGTIDTVASDHAAKAKTRDDDFFAAPYGSPQVETMVPLIYRGVAEGNMTIQRWVQVMCENPARIFGLYPRKGAIRRGSDADLVLFDPNEKRELHAETLHSNATYTPYEGIQVQGVPVLSMQRGQIVLENGQLQAQPGQGQFLRTDSGRASLDKLRPEREAFDH